MSQASLKSKSRYDCHATSSQESLKSKARSDCKTSSSQASLKSKGRYAIRAWVPQSAYLSPNLRNKLKNFALKPLKSVSSPRRRQELRQEIERSQNDISANGCLWDNNSLAFVAEAKAKTIQLRHRTLELLRKTDDSEELERSLWEEQQAPEDPPSDSRDEGNVEDEACGDLPVMNDNDKNARDAGGSSDEEVTVEETERRMNKIKSIRSSIRRRLLSTTMMDDELFKNIDNNNRRGRTPRNSHPAQLATPHNRQDGPLLRRIRTHTIKTEHEAFPWDSDHLDTDISEADGLQRHDAWHKSPRQTVTRTSLTFSARGSARQSFSRSPMGSFRQTLSPRPGSRQAAAPMVQTGAQTPQQSPRMLVPSPAPNQLQSPRASNQRRLSSSLDRSTVLREDTREINGTSKTCNLRLCGDRIAGGLTLEAFACAGARRGTIVSNPVKRHLETEEVEQLFAWGEMQDKSPSEKYAWIFDLVQLTMEEDSDVTISLGGWDKFKQEMEKSIRMSELGLKTDMKEIFQTTRLRTKRQSREEASLSQCKQLDEFEVRKRNEMKALAKKHAMDESAAEALSQWYSRIDPSGTGKIHEQEFTTFVHKICQAGCRSYENSLQEIRWLLGELHTARSRSKGGHLAFVQFADWLISKFPQIKSMSAYQIQRFSDFAEEADFEHPQSPGAQCEMASLLKSRKSESTRASLKECTLKSDFRRDSYFKNLQTDHFLEDPSEETDLPLAHPMTVR